MNASTAPIRSAIITGAGSGIGRAAALALLEAGWSVTLTGRREQALLEVAAEWGYDADRASRVLVVPTDVTDEDAVAQLFSKTVDRFGRLDLLFNNAGNNLARGPIEDLDYQAWRGVVDVNLNGMFLCAREAFRVMKAQSPRGGRIINNGSISAHAPRPDTAAYTATKHAVTGLTKSLALDGRKHDIACGQIDIGNAASEMTARMAVGIAQADGRVVPEDRMGLSSVASAINWMASLPPDSNALFLTVMATKMPFVGRG
jgi:NAD(P)-dependent dehydrogenase (short-subunit alcohol dehydrogenase family)